MTELVCGRACARPLTMALAAAGVALATAFAAAPAGAAAPDKTWNCRSSVLFATVGSLRVEPLVANGNPNGADRDFCATDDAGPAPISLAGISATTASATTRIASVAPANQQPSSSATIENLSIGGPVATLLTAQTVTSTASASCVGSRPLLSGGSRVLAAKVLGLPVTADGVLTVVGNTLNGLPTGQVLTVRFNEQQRTATGLTQRAVDVELKAGSTVLVSAVAGETKVAAQGDVCSATTGGPGGGSGGTGGGSGGGGGNGSGAKPCPAGSTYEQPGNVCVILRTRADGSTERIVVGKPSAGPSGGRVVALADLPASLRGTVCAKGKGPKYAILGTNGPDRITGTNGADRIMTLGGKDKASGGRGNDCIDGGSGGGTLTGDQGRDTVVGGSGRDSIKGGADADRLVGLGGPDRITADFGKDKVEAGSGNDFVNVSINGPAASVNCGPGKDRVSLNANEVRKTKGCERVAVLAKRRS